MADVDNVTFVGGKPIEQHEGLDSNIDDDTRAEAEAAVREAIKKAAGEAKENAPKAAKSDGRVPEGAKKDTDEDDGDEEVENKPVAKKAKAKEAPERGPDGKFLPREPKEDDGDEEDEVIDPSKASLKQLLKNREKVAAQKKETHSQFEQERQRIAEETRRVQETWQQIQQMQQEVQRERQKLELLRKNPAMAIREIGLEPEQFIMDLAQDGTPEGVAKRQQAELQRQIEELRNWKEQQAQAYQRAQEEAQWQQAVQYREHIKNQFLSDALNEETRPHTATFYKGREHALMAYADFIANEYRNMSGGREASLQEVADFIEDDLAERANRWYESKSGSKQTTRTTEAKPGKGSKGKSLNPEVASERRSLGRKTLKDLDDEERLAAAREAASLAIQDSD